MSSVATTSSPPGEETTQGKLLLALSDALEDLSIKVSDLVPGRKGGDDASLLSNAFRDDGSDYMSLSLVWRLLDMLPKDPRGRAAAGTRSSDATTWEAVGKVCDRLGCPFSGRAKDDGKRGKDESEQMRKDRAFVRKLELALFLAGEVQCRRLLLLRKEKEEANGSAVGTKKQEEEEESAKSRDDDRPADKSARLVNRLLSGTSELSIDELGSILSDVYPALTEDQVEKVHLCNDHLKADYAMRRKLLKQKFDVTTSAFLWNGAAGDDADAEKRNRSAGANASDSGERIKSIAGGLSRVEVS
eukprot:CAMPEP_0113562866 /NCGR_PEP_ID=MMETSP0015_2-20120614/20754_1 /TAXON_ID=2838 /ORGANISM="Odontella" /LENGTH=301 /DNA_ID=CAMNT_0000464789 /DNA_START=62 /DNA_END=963 /DNA_ORIENTATION=- /assembly_acc=CAM_ASM_000160